MVKDESVRGYVNSLALDASPGQAELTEEKLFEVNTPAPKRVVVKNEDELVAKLDASREDIEEGRTSSADEVYSRLETKYVLFQNSAYENSNRRVL